MGPGFESLKVHQNGDRGKLDPHEYSAKRVRVNIAEGPPVPIPNTEVKLCYADNTCLETSWEDRSMRTQWGSNGSPQRKYTVAKKVRVSIAEGPPVPIPNTEVKLCYADNTCLETDWEDRSMRTQVTVTLYNTAMLCCLPLLLDISVFLGSKHNMLTSTNFFLYSSLAQLVGDRAKRLRVVLRWEVTKTRRNEAGCIEARVSTMFWEVSMIV